MEQVGNEGRAPPGPPLVEVEGIWFPKFFETNRPMKEQIDYIRGLDLRDDDVLICAYAKAGTHWTWEVVSMLMAGKVEYRKQSKETVMLEVVELEGVESLPSPRVLNTHLPVNMLPRQVKDKKGRIIFVYRNPKDLLVSLYFHIKQMPGSSDLALQELEEAFLTGWTPFGSFFNYMKEWDAFIKENPDLSIFKASYEDMKEDPVGSVRELSEFLGVNAPPELCAAIADACGFQKLKHAAETMKEISPHFSRPDNLPVQMFRRGEVGDWKNHLTVAQSERLDAAIKQQLDGCDFNFRYTLWEDGFRGLTLR
ncbi:sulfotransferase 1A1-like [Pomacea canaliculata]|uniref:sulfotransferase 1A1-like n=1 Tax=Pomacea canaliculata TaxID=400727 RepID=UPI000D7376A5|nr:sulfotransferase 1A1-like [Pomacea canaliculata]